MVDALLIDRGEVGERLQTHRKERVSTVGNHDLGEAMFPPRLLQDFRSLLSENELQPAAVNGEILSAAGAPRLGFLEQYLQRSHDCSSEKDEYRSYCSVKYFSEKINSTLRIQAFTTFVRSDKGGTGSFENLRIESSEI